MTMITLPIDTSVLLDLIRNNGYRLQESVAIGEIGELLSLFGREAQGRATEEEWVDEISDCLIMITQLMIMRGRQEKVLNRIRQKMSILPSRKVLHGDTNSSMRHGSHKYREVNPTPASSTVPPTGRICRGGEGTQAQTPT